MTVPETALDTLLSDCLHVLYERLVMRHPDVSRLGPEHTRIHLMRDTKWSEFARYLMLHADAEFLSADMYRGVEYGFEWGWAGPPGPHNMFAELQAMLCEPLDEMPTYMGHYCLTIRSAAEWRLEMGR